jgi:hypothetical protein
VSASASVASVADQAPAAPAPLPDPESLTPDSDFTMFMRSGVDPQARNAALKRLFSDPHFNQMDGLDVYIDDYGRPDPIPAAMLRRLNQARSLRLFDEDEDEDGRVDERVDEVPPAGVEPPGPAAGTVTGEAVPEAACGPAAEAGGEEADAAAPLDAPRAEGEAAASRGDPSRA